MTKTTGFYVTYFPSASRYTQINVLMKVHVGALYEFQQTFRSHSSCRKLTEGAHLEVLLWRAFLLSLSVNPASFDRPLTGLLLLLVFWCGRATSTTHVHYWGSLCYPHRSLLQRTPASRIRTNTLHTPRSSVNKDTGTTQLCVCRARRESFVVGMGAEGLSAVNVM